MSEATKITVRGVTVAGVIGRRRQCTGRSLYRVKGSPAPG